MSAEENKVVVRRFWGVWEEGNIGLVDESLAPDYVNHSSGMPVQPTGPEGANGPGAGQSGREHVPAWHA